MSKRDRAYLRAKAIWLATVLEPPQRIGSHDYPRLKHGDIELAFMDFKNLHDELFDELNAYF